MKEKNSNRMLKKKIENDGWQNKRNTINNEGLTNNSIFS